MKEKSQIEKKAEEKQITLLSTALSEASNAGGHWLNASGKGYPRLYPKGVSVSAFNALFMTLHSDKNGCKTNQFTLFSDAKAQGASVRENEQGVPFLFYNWNKYVHRNNPEQVISRDDYMKLYEEEQKLYKGVHNREIRTLFNIDQTTLPYVDKERYETTLRRYGSAVERGYTEADNRRLHIQFNDFLLRMRDNLVPVRLDGSGVPHYETDKDAVYMPRQREFRHYHDYIQEALRQIVSATGHQQRLAREGMVMKNGVAPSEDAVRQERLVVELASGIKMLELGLPARLSEESLKTVEYWCRELKENPNLMDALESDVNNAIEVINKAERGEKIEYATMRNRRDTSTMEEQMPKHYFVSNEIRQHPDKETKKIVLVIDPQAKTADVILPAGASTEVDNEIPGMNKGRIMRALQKDGIEQVRFYNTTLDVASAVKQANEIGFDHVEMIQDDKKRWALYIKPENKSGYSIYPDKEDINRFFSTLKQAMDNIGKVRMELAHKYYALAEVKPDLKVDLFSSEMPEIDLNRIQRVSVFKTKQDGIQCVATIDGQKQPARSVTPQQWQRMWIAEERDSYKRHLAATLFADVLQKGQSQEAHTGEKQQKEAELWPLETVAQERTESDNKGISPERQLWDKLKANHPDALQLLRTKDGYRLYNEDAVQGAKILGITLKEYPEGDITASTEFSTEQLDSYLSKLVRAGARVAISDMEEQETHRGFHR